MECSQRTKTAYQTLFSGSPEEYLQILDFLRYLHGGAALQKTYDHPLFAPSTLWRNWLSETFVGFSSDKLLLLGGHNFETSIEVGPTNPDAKPNATRLRALAVSARKAMFGQQPTLSSHISRFRDGFTGIYVDFDVLPEHESWFDTHPSAYFRTLEAHILRANRKPPRKLLEIGAGACVNVAFYRSLSPQLKCVVIDPPETIFAGFAFPKTVFPKLRIYLPHQVQNEIRPAAYDVVFLLPFQFDLVPDGEFDLCFSMGSFQEMDEGREQLH